MNRTTCRHEPLDFAFYLQDPNRVTPLGGSASKEAVERRYAARRGVVLIRVVSEFSEVPITVEVADGETPRPDGLWDYVADCEIEATGHLLELQDSSGEKFASIGVTPGAYHVRIFYGGQMSRQPNGSSSDYYALQLWPSRDASPFHRQVRTPD